MCVYYFIFGELIIVEDFDGEFVIRMFGYFGWDVFNIFGEGVVFVLNGVFLVDFWVVDHVGRVGYCWYRGEREV